MNLSRLTLASLACGAVLLATMDAPMAQTGQPVTLDVVVLDGSGKPVSGLAQDRFEVRDDGTRVTIQSFEEVKVAPGKRTVIFVLDDVGVPASGTVAIQNITRSLVSSAEPGDNVSVLHLHGKGQGLENDPPTVLGRIDSYIAGSARATPDAAAEVTTFIADLAEKLQPLGRHRKTIVCVGSTGACNVSAPRQTVDNLRMESWNRAVTAAARANAAGVRGRAFNHGRRHRRGALRGDRRRCAARGQQHCAAGRARVGGRVEPLSPDLSTDHKERTRHVPGPGTGRRPGPARAGQGFPRPLTLPEPSRAGYVYRLE